MKINYNVNGKNNQFVMERLPIFFVSFFKAIDEAIRV